MIFGGVAYFFECPVFLLTIDVWPDFQRSTGNSIFQPKIRTFDQTLERSTENSNSNVSGGSRHFRPNV